MWADPRGQSKRFRCEASRIRRLICTTVAAPHCTTPVKHEVPTENKLQHWSPDTPRLYAALVTLAQDGRATDAKYDRFGWREFQIKEEDFYRAIHLYYEMIGCDPQSGRPHQAKLLELGLEWVAEKLASEAKD